MTGNLRPTTGDPDVAVRVVDRVVGRVVRAVCVTLNPVGRALQF